MVVVKVKDKRYAHGFKAHFFHTDTVTKEVVEFVEKHPKAYYVMGNEEMCMNRDEFLQKYGKQRKG